MNIKSLLFLGATLIYLTTFVSNANVSVNNTQDPQTNTNSNQSSNTVTGDAYYALGFYKPWARPTTYVAGKVSNSAIYLSIINRTQNSYNAINVSSEAANKVEFHQTFTDENGVSKMVKVDKLAIPANTTVKMKPGGAHIMLYDLKRNLNIGDKFKATIFFDDNSTKTLDVIVSSAEPN